MTTTCEVIGHRWEPVPNTEKLNSLPMVVCHRCGESGWVIVEEQERD